MKVFILLFLLTSCFSQAQKTELTVAMNSEFDTLHPAVNSMMAGVLVLDAILRPLIALTPEGQEYPVLIEEIPSLKNKQVKLLPGKSGKSLQVEITFKEKATWGDGKPVTCEDLKFAYEVGQSANASIPDKELYENLERIEIDKVNAKKCTLFYKQAKWDFYLNFPRPIPAHLEKPIFTKYQNEPQAYERNSLFQKAPQNPGLYNGPFRISELKLGSHIVLEQNPHFYGTPASLKKIIFKFILNTGTMEANLRAGNIDMASSIGLTFDQALAFEKKVQAEKLNYAVTFVPGVIYSHLDFNLDHDALKDLRVRQALTHAVNRDEINQAFFDGRLTPAVHFSTKFDRWYTESPKDISLYAFDRKKAAELLDAAGWKLDSKDGYRAQKQEKLSLTVSGVADNKVNETILVYIKSAFKAIGVDLQIKNYPARVLFSEILRKRKFDLGFYSWVSSPNTNQMTTLHSRMIPTEQNRWSGSNRPGWKNPQVDHWLEAFDAEFEEKKRIQLMRKIMAAYTAELPAMPLLYRANNSVIPKNLKNYKMSGHQFTEFLKVEDWQFAE